MSDLPVRLVLWPAICPRLPSSFLVCPSAYFTSIHLHNNSTDVHTRVHAVWIQIYSIPLYGSKNNQPHTRAPATSPSRRLTKKPSDSLKCTRSHTRTHTGTDTQVATRTNKQRWINGNQIVIMGLGENNGDNGQGVPMYSPPLQKLIPISITQ